MAPYSVNSNVRFAGLVNINTHSLYTEVHSENNSPELFGRPPIVIIQGIGSTIHEWTAAIRGLAKLSQVISYERSGFGVSEASAREPTAAQAASELDVLLQKSKIVGPYVIVAHSYGGIIAREYVQLRPQSVSSMIFVDANTEETPSTYPNQYVRAMSAGLNTLEVTIGLDHALATEEWIALMEAEEHPRNVEAATREAAYYHESGRSLAAKNQLSLSPPILGRTPIVILHANYALDISAIFAAGVQVGNGTEDERRGITAFMSSCNKQEERMQRKMLALSSEGRFMHVSNSGHQIHMVKPAVIVDAVRSVFKSQGHFGTIEDEHATLPL